MKTAAMVVNLLLWAALVVAVFFAVKLTLQVFAGSAAGDTCCAYKGRDAACVPCRPTREL